MIDTDTQTATLRELTEIADSGTWGDEGRPGDGSPVLRSSDIADNTLSFHDAAWRTIPENDRERRKLATGDIIVTKSSGSPEHIGKCAVFTQPDDGRDYYFSNFMLRIRAKRGKADHRWLFYWLSSERGRDVLTAMNSTTSGLRNLSVPRYFEQEVPIPFPDDPRRSLAEQKRIAAILDKADAIRRRRQEAARLADTLIPSVFYEMFGDPAANTKRLPVATIGELAPVLTGATPSRLVADYYGGSIPWVKTTEVTNGIIRATEETLTEQGMESSRCELYPIGSLVIALYGQGATRGRTALLAIEAAANQACAIIPPKTTYVTSFLWTQLRMSYERLRGEARGGNQPNLNLQIVRSFEVLNPSLDRQKAFDQHFKRHAALLETQAAGEKKADDLFNALVQRAFRGEL